MESIKFKQKKLLSLYSNINYDTYKTVSFKINQLDKSLKKLEIIKFRTQRLISLKVFLLKNKNNLINLINLEAHKTKLESKAEFEYALGFVDYSIKVLSSYEFKSKSINSRNIIYKSIGTVFAITPYNDPLAGITRKIAPSIASGSPLIIKTSSNCIKLCKYLNDNLPKDLNDILQFIFIKDKSIIDTILQNQKIKLITFTGSTDIGIKLNNIKTNHTQKKILELGGINYALIFDNHNLDKVIDEIIIRKTKAAGQACSSINKLFVHSSVKNEFEKILISKVSKLICGCVTDVVQPHFGPVISKNHFKFLNNLEKVSLKNGKLICRSSTNNTTENEYPLTVITSKINDKIFDELETFGPLLGVSYFTNNKNIFNKISKSKYSLVCYIFSKSKNIIKMTENLNFGSIGVNTTKIQDPSCPTGGNNLSGIGREGGIWGFQEFLTTVNYVKY